MQGKLFGWGAVAICGICLFHALFTGEIKNPGAGSAPLVRADNPVGYWMFVMFFAAGFVGSLVITVMLT